MAGAAAQSPWLGGGSRPTHMYPDVHYTHYANQRPVGAPQWPEWGAPGPGFDNYWSQHAPPWGPAPAGWQTLGRFAELEDTDRLPRPSDMHWADRGGWGEPPITGGPITPIPSDPPPMQLGAPSPAIGSFSPFPIPPSPFPGSAAPLRQDTQLVLFTRRYPFWGKYLAARPTDWRHDYLPPRRFNCVSRLRLAGSDRIRVNLESAELSRLILMPHSKMPTMSFDLRSDDPFDPHNLELLTTAGRPFNPTDLAQLATVHPVGRLRFYHPRLPWYIDVRASQPNGVLVGDILHQIHAKLHRTIRPQDFSNTVLDARDREEVTDAYIARCGDNIQIIQQGAKRVDFMGTDCVLQGFMGGRNGMWLMKTSKVSDTDL